MEFRKRPSEENVNMRTWMGWLGVCGLLLAGCENQAKTEMNKDSTAGAEPSTGTGYYDSSSGRYSGTTGSAAPATVTPTATYGGSTGSTYTPPATDSTLAANDGVRYTEPAAKSKSRSDDSEGSSTYIVKKGDTLSELSVKFYGTSTKWKKIWEANRTRVSDPKRLKVGTKLIIP
jgi:nucleoid-associated protein YgaU